MFSWSKNDKNNSYTTKIREQEYEYDHIRCSSDNSQQIRYPTFGLVRE